MKIATKILTVILTVSLLALFIISVVSYTEMLNLTHYSFDANTRLGSFSSDESEMALKQQAEEYIAKIANEQALKSDATLLKVQDNIAAMSEYMTLLYQNKSNFKGRMLPLPNETEMDVASSKYMLPPGVYLTDEIRDELFLISNAEYMLSPTLENNKIMNNIYLGTDSGISYRYSRSNAYNPDYDPRTRDWYNAAKDNIGNPVWIDTYVDSYGSICATVSMAFNDAAGNPHGVIATDITLTQMQQDIISMKIGKTGYAFLIDSKGNIIAHPDYSDEGFETSPLGNSNNELNSAITTMLKTKEGLSKFLIGGREVYLAYQTLPTTDWTLGIIVEVDEIVKPAVDTRLKIGEFTEESQVHINEALTNVLINFVIILSISAMLILVLSYILSKSITGPLKIVVNGVSKISGGNLDISIPVKGKDEVAELGNAFNTMTADLKTYMESFSQITKEKERIGAELDIATKIQISMMPHIFPPFTKQDNFDIYATMLPAKEVGGDFYDFFIIDKNHVGVVIADVSGKGVPAALFMVIAKTLIKNHAMMGLSPAEIFNRTNAQLCEGNDAEMFVTAFLGILNTTTGEFSYVNAGHNSPCIKKFGGEFEFFRCEGRPNFVLAGYETTKYREYTTKLDHGDIIYLYTDGITEATDANSELFGDNRLIEALNKHNNEGPAVLLSSVKEEIDTFVKTAPQFDDMTMLVFKLHEAGANSE